VALSVPRTSPAAEQAKHPVHHGDDIGWMQPIIYHRGLMVCEDPPTSNSDGH